MEKLNPMNPKKRENIEGEPREMGILTHRGLDPTKENYFAESSREAFADQIARGFGLEFDVQLTKDGDLIVLHDSNLTRLSAGIDERKIGEVTLKELLAMNFSGCHLASLKDLVQMIAENSESRAVNALHIKSKNQVRESLDKILEQLQETDAERFVLFDLKVAAAQQIKEKNPRLHRAASVAHPYDIERYNQAVGDTLLSLEQVIENRDLYDWVWLDEWDRTDKEGNAKSLYNKDTFDKLRGAGFKIGLVTPELHATSPGLLGGEAHPDAADMVKLESRFKEIIYLGPDLICTDYPDIVKSLAEKHAS